MRINFKFSFSVRIFIEKINEIDWLKIRYMRCLYGVFMTYAKFSNKIDRRETELFTWGFLISGWFFSTAFWKESIFYWLVKFHLQSGLKFVTRLHEKNQPVLLNWGILTSRHASQANFSHVNVIYFTETLCNIRIDF